MDFVDEENRAAAVEREAVASLVDDLPELLHPREHRRERHELGACRVREKMRERRLAGAGRTPEDQRVEHAALDHLAQDAAWAEQMLLTDELVERRRTHPLCERCGATAFARRYRAEEV